MYDCAATENGPIFYTHLLRPKNREFYNKCKHHANVSCGEIMERGEFLCFQSEDRKRVYLQNNPDGDFDEIVLDTPTPAQKKAVETLYERSKEMFDDCPNVSRSQIIKVLEKSE